MKERPIIFSAPMVRAILEGRKTQTRRIVKPQPEPIPDDVWQSRHYDNGWWWACSQARTMVAVRDMSAFCPYGSTRDRLWVKESHALCNAIGNNYTNIIWRAGPWRNGIEPSAKWRSPIHMPRWAARITLEITDIRVERLQDISEADAQAEGVTESIVLPGDRGSFVASFGYLWQQIHGPKSWAANPWVWVIEFERVEGDA